MSPEWTNQAGVMSSPFRGHWLDTMGLCQSAHLLRYLSLPVLFAGVTCVERAEWHGRALKAPLFCSEFIVGLLWTGLCDDLVLSISPRMWHEQTILWSHPQPLPPGCWSCSPKGHWCPPSSQSLVSTPALLNIFSFLTRPPLPAGILHFHASPPRLHPLTPPGPSSYPSH